MIITKRTGFEILTILILVRINIAHIVKNTWPAVCMPTFCDPWSNHLLLSAYWTEVFKLLSLVHITEVILDHLLDPIPLYLLVSIVEVEQVLLLFMGSEWVKDELTITLSEDTLLKFLIGCSSAPPTRTVGVVLLVSVLLQPTTGEPK